MITLSKFYKTLNPGTITEKKALKNMNLTLKEGDCFIVIGGNGAGKSKLLNLMAGVYISDWGTITLDGEDVTLQKEHVRAKNLGRVFQDPMMGTAASMEIEENLAMANKRGKVRSLKWGISADERKMFKEKLAMLDLSLENRMKSKVGLLSGGQRQALTLLMATLRKPKLLLLDEHTAALDPKTAKKVLELTDQIVGENNLTTFMVTHNMKQAISMGNRLIMMNEGRIIYDVSGEEKKKLQVSDLLEKFQISVAGTDNDRMLLGN